MLGQSVRSAKHLNPRTNKKKNPFLLNERWTADRWTSLTVTGKTTLKRKNKKKNRKYSPKIVAGPALNTWPKHGEESVDPATCVLPTHDRIRTVNERF